MARIREVHTDTEGTYWAPRITVELANQGHGANHKRVQRRVRLERIVGHHNAQKMRTTTPAEDLPPTSDLAGRRFAPGAPDVCWCGDIPQWGVIGCGQWGQ